MESFNNGEEKPKRKYPLLVAENAFSNVGTAASCPICNKVVHGDNAAFNTHIDICMNAKAIKSMDNPVYGSVESNPLKLVYKQPNIDDEWKIFKKLSNKRKKLIIKICNITPLNTQIQSQNQNTENNTQVIYYDFLLSYFIVVCIFFIEIVIVIGTIFNITINVYNILK